MKTLFGLPEEVKFCSRCVISNQRPNSAVEFHHTAQSTKSTIAFDADNICSACRVADQKKLTDWESREEELHELSRKWKSFPGPHNVMVPGSGGKDSFFQAHQLKFRFGFRPLTITWAPHLYTEWGRRNHDAWISAGFDNILVTPNRQIHRLLTRLAVDNLFHPFQPFMIGQKNLAPRLAQKFKIPLIFYGENEAEYGNPGEDAETAIRNPKYFTVDDRREMFLSGLPVGELEDEFGLTAEDLDFYIPLKPETIEDAEIEVHYLGYYIPWHPQGVYYYAVEHGGFTPSPERTPGTYSKYNSIDDKIDDLHYWTTYVKFGIGRATYDAAQEIRNGEISREEGVALARRFDGEWPARFESELMDYLSVDKRLGSRVMSRFEEPQMTKENFLEKANEFRSPHLWKRNGSEWLLRQRIS